MAQAVLTASVRNAKGKEAARKLRAKKLIPAVLYGPNTAPVLLAVGASDLDRILRGASGERAILDLQLQTDSGPTSRTAILKELQVHSVMDQVLHADFMEISMDRAITVKVPVHLVNTPVGVVNGGILQAIAREVTIECLPGNMIDGLTADVSGLELGQSLHVRDLKAPEGIRLVDDGQVTVAVVTGAKAEAPKPEAAEAEAAGEVPKQEEGSEPSE
jgi:large subunit ribosomal protein L25